MIKSHQVSASSSYAFEHSGQKHFGGPSCPPPMSNRVNSEVEGLELEQHLAILLERLKVSDGSTITYQEIRIETWLPVSGFA